MKCCELYLAAAFFVCIKAIKNAPETATNLRHETAENRITENTSGFRPSQLLGFTESDATYNANKYPPSYLESNNQYQPDNSPNQRQATLSSSKQFSFPTEGQPESTPIVTYLDPYTQKYDYAQPSGQQQREQQTYTVQSTLLVEPQQQPYKQSAPTSDSYQQMRPGIVLDERPAYSAAYSYRPTTPTPPTLPTLAKSPIQATQKISYDSHDYPPPSYAQQQTSNFVQSAATQAHRYTGNTITNNKPHHTTINYNTNDFNNKRPLSSPSNFVLASSINQQQPPQQQSYSPNYANYYDNYMQGSQQQQQQLHQQQFTESPQRPFVPPPSPPQTNYATTNGYLQYKPIEASFARPPHNRPHNFYDYQIGEQQPPYASAQPNYSPYLHNTPPMRPAPASSSLSGLASLFSSTTPQQYAPQFTNLLFGGGEAAANTPGSQPSTLSSLFGAFNRPATSNVPTYIAGSNSIAPSRPLNSQLIRALENIARNDDLQCVPKVLCQMIAGQTLRGQLPAFVTSPAITNFLAGFPAASPALIYGRAALLGLSGGERSCMQTYEKCPKNEYEILYYLNNHRGGFFKFFSEPEEHKPVKQSSNYGGSALSSAGSSIFNILAALTGNTLSLPAAAPPAPKPTAPKPDIADGISNFFTRILSEYLSGVEFQRRRRRNAYRLSRRNGVPMPLDYDDEEDDLDTRGSIMFQDPANDDDVGNDDNLIGVLHFPEDTQGRILFKDFKAAAHGFFPAAHISEEQQENAKKMIIDFNRVEAQRKLRFPKDETPISLNFAKELREAIHEDDQGSHAEHTRQSRRIIFKEAEEPLFDSTEQQSSTSAASQRGARVIFPDHYEHYIRKGRILNRPTYAPSYGTYMQDQDQDKFVVSNSHRTPHYEGANYNYNHNKVSFSDSDDNHVQYTGGNSIRPTQAPHYNYPSTNYVNYNRYSSNYQANRRPPPARHEDDKNIYVNNAHGVTEYFITPDGRKVPLV